MSPAVVVHGSLLFYVSPLMRIWAFELLVMRLRLSEQWQFGGNERHTYLTNKRDPGFPVYAGGLQDVIKNCQEQEPKQPYASSQRLGASSLQT